MIDPGRAIDPSSDPQDGPRKARKQLRVLPSLAIPDPPAPPPMPPSPPLGGSAPPQVTQQSAPAPSPSLPQFALAEEPQQKIQQLELELEATRDELEALHQMLEDLPEIFERKFRQRQKAFLDHHEHLLADNRALRERLYALAPAAPPSAAALPPGTPAGSRRQRLRRAVASLFGRD